LQGQPLATKKLGQGRALIAKAFAAFPRIHLGIEELVGTVLWFGHRAMFVPRPSVGNRLKDLHEACREKKSPFDVRVVPRWHTQEQRETDMRFMIIRRADEETEAGRLPTEAELAAMGKYNEEMVKAGVMLEGEGLHPSSKGAKVVFQNGKPSVIDGPFAETKELIAGFSMIQVKSREEAIEWVKRWPAIDGGGNAQIELRQVFEAEDFGDAFTPELREQEEQIRKTAAENA
jgi:hypothetical protein